MPFVSFGKTDDQVTRIDVALSVIACKFCGYPDGTEREKERERERVAIIICYYYIPSSSVLTDSG